MRDAVHAVALLGLTALLAWAFPFRRLLAPTAPARPARAAFCSYVPVEPEDYAALARSVRPSWRLAGEARPSAGQMDDPICRFDEPAAPEPLPLSFAPAAAAAFSAPWAPPAAPALTPRSLAAAPAAARPPAGEEPAASAPRPAYSRAQMLALEDFDSLNGQQEKQR